MVRRVCGTAADLPGSHWPSRVDATSTSLPHISYRSFVVPITPATCPCRSRQRTAAHCAAMVPRCIPSQAARPVTSPGIPRDAVSQWGRAARCRCGAAPAFRDGCQSACGTARPCQPTFSAQSQNMRAWHPPTHPRTHTTTHAYCAQRRSIRRATRARGSGAERLARESPPHVFCAPASRRAQCSCGLGACGADARRPLQLVRAQCDPRSALGPVGRRAGGRGRLAACRERSS